MKKFDYESYAKFDKDNLILYHDEPIDDHTEQTLQALNEARKHMRKLNDDLTIWTLSSEEKVLPPFEDETLKPILLRAPFMSLRLRDTRILSFP